MLVAAEDEINLAQEEEEAGFRFPFSIYPRTGSFAMGRLMHVLSKHL